MNILYQVKREIHDQGQADQDENNSQKAVELMLDESPNRFEDLIETTIGQVKLTNIDYIIVKFPDLSNYYALTSATFRPRGGK